ncbi:rolling circle replication-associated protein [Helcococcus bovis]|uniref:rolling circle replication-associated protein n=1 Tax=Helcococcus bovis TaxID=3153252 RepID=UPI0038BA17FD
MRKNKNTPKIYNFEKVKAYWYGDTLEITNAIGLERQSIIILPEKEYLVISTGEIKKMNTENRTRKDDLKSVRKTMKKLTRLISNNFHGGNNELWITLTFREHITDTETAYELFEKFINRLKYRYKNLAYISVIEPQASGRWHFHVLLKDTTENKLYIKNEELAEIWSNGFTKVKRIKDSDNVANYLIAYLTDLNIEDSDSVNKPSKKIEKGLRLHLYPKGLRIFRASRNIKKVETKTDSKWKIMKEFDINKNPNFVGKFEIKIADDKKYINYTEFYDDISK